MTVELCVQRATGQEGRPLRPGAARHRRHVRRRRFAAGMVAVGLVVVIAGLLAWSHAASDHPATASPTSVITGAAHISTTTTAAPPSHGRDPSPPPHTPSLLRRDLRAQPMARTRLH